jgi:ferritin-like metal-binding protein YciE
MEGTRVSVRRFPGGGAWHLRCSETNGRQRGWHIGGDIMEVQDLQHLYVDLLKDTLNAERQILKALPKLVRHAENEDLRNAFVEHQGVTETQVERLKEVFAQFGQTARGKHCPGMEGLLKEGDEIVEEIEAGNTADAALIGAAQKVEHYEIAAYGTLIAYANLLGYVDAAPLLQMSLDEEKDADRKLTGLAMTCINVEAAAGDEVPPKGEKKNGRRVAKGADA